MIKKLIITLSLIFNFFFYVPIAFSEKIVSSPSSKQWLFGNKSFIALGMGTVNYPGVENINSTNDPAYFGSFGGYGYGGHIIFDLSFYYSQHYIRTPNSNFQDRREALRQPAVAMAVKFSPLEGRMKPYVGLSGSLVYRQWFFVQRSGAPIDNEENFDALRDIADKKWNPSFDAGVVVGADVALGEHIGLNADLRYHWNLYTENYKGYNSNNLLDAQVLDKRDSIILSGSFRYYF